MNEKYIRKAITKALTMPALPNKAPFAYERGEKLTVYCDNYCCWAIPSNTYCLSHPQALEMSSLIQRLALDEGILHEVRDTGRREIRTGSKKSIIAILACEDFEILVNESMLKLFESLNVRYWAKSYDSMLIIEDVDYIGALGYGIGGIMPIKPRNRQ